MRRIFAAVLLVSACARDVTAPRMLRLVPSIVPIVLEGGVFRTGPLYATGSGPVVTSDNQHTNVGMPVVITAAVVDQDNNRVSNVAVSWQVLSGGSVDVRSVLSDSIGNASVNWTLDTIARVDSVQASIPNGATLTMVATGVHGAAAVARKASGDGQNVAAGATSQPLVISVTDRYGNPVSGVVVAWAVNGGGSLSAITSTTDTNGATQATLATDSASTSYRVIATFGVMPAAIFTVSANK